MAYTKYNLTSSAWTLVANNKTSASFYNVGSYPIYVTFTSTNVNPAAETVGMYIDTNGGRDKATFTGLTHVATPTYMWARSAGGKGSTLVIETN